MTTPSPSRKPATRRNALLRYAVRCRRSWGWRGTARTLLTDATQRAAVISLLLDKTGLGYDREIRGLLGEMGAA